MSNPIDEQQQYEQLMVASKDADKAASQLIDKGRVLTEAGTRMHDLTRALREVAADSPDGFFGGPVFETNLQTLREFTRVADDQVTQIQSDTSLLTLSFVASTASMIGSVAYTMPDDWDPKQPELRPLFELIDRDLQLADVKRLLTRLGLDQKRAASRSALELLVAADESYRRPSGDQRAPALIQLRESIERCVADLLALRKTQEEAGGWVEKINSIARHCAQSVVSPSTVDTVAQSTHTLINELSAAKQMDIGSERVRRLFLSGVALLHSILSLIDPERLRTR